VFDLEVHMEVIVVYGRIEVPARDVTKTNRANSTIAAQVVEVLRGFLLQRDEGVVPAGEWRVMNEQGADGEGRMHARNWGLSLVFVLVFEVLKLWRTPQQQLHLRVSSLLDARGRMQGSRLLTLNRLGATEIPSGKLCLTQKPRTMPRRRKTCSNSRKSRRRFHNRKAQAARPGLH
jgi:hypothetical protein